MAIKPNWNQRLEKAREELRKTPVRDSEIVKLISKCLKENNIDGKVITVDLSLQDINYKEIMEKYETNAEAHIIWVQFVKCGHVAVVGAGKDIGFPQSGKLGTGFILSGLHCVEWDKTKVIIIPVKGLDEKNGIKNVDNILKCRNGVEHCIGEYLIKNNVPILNFYQHRNYSECYWGKCEKQNYNIVRK